MKPIILMVGLNHTTAPVQVREQIASQHCMRDEAQASLFDQLRSSVLSEALILGTCNRTEIYAVALDCAQGEQILRGAFMSQDGFRATHPDFLYAYSGREAVVHLFAVASGIDSMIVGEFEILGQVRTAYLSAVAAKSLGPVLHQLFQRAINVGKRARSETLIGAGATSVAYAAVALARRQLGELEGRKALVIGSGEMGRRAARNLANDGACTVLVASRTYSHAARLAEGTGTTAIPFEELPAALAEVDLVISATKAPHLILTAPQLANAVSARGRRPLCLIDIAVPRDIDPAAGTLENVSLFNIDDLKGLVAGSLTTREKAIGQVRTIIEAETDEFWKWHMSRRAAPALRALNTRAESIRKAELDKTLRRLKHLSESDRKAVTALSAGIVKKLLAAPREQLKARMQCGDGQFYLDMLREIFDLDQLQ